MIAIARGRGAAATDHRRADNRARRDGAKTNPGSAGPPPP
jgi:hypothetical protein